VRLFGKAAFAPVDIAVSGSLVRRPSPSTAPGVTCIGHRGASAYAAENTLSAIRAAIGLGADMVEIDVQRSRDGQLVLVHDATLNRTTDVQRKFPRRAPWRVGDFTYTEMCRLDAGSWRSDRDTGERIATLAEAIDLVRSSHAGLVLELKTPERYPGVESDVVAELRRCAGFTHPALASRRLLAQSFDFGSMRTLKELDPAVPVGLLGTPERFRLPALGAWADLVNPRHSTVNARYVAEVHRNGMQCLLWTVNRASKMHRAIDNGADGVITNRPDLLNQVLVDRAGTAA
jgi:glycerophosphoryl diester phosphodiesterase